MSMALLSACSSKPTKNTSDIKRPSLSDSGYAQLITEKTHNDKKYNGFHNLYEVTATLLTTDIQMAQLDRIRFYQSWDQRTYQEQRERKQQNMSQDLQVFLSYYSPKKELKKLHSGETPWKVYLESNGKRYEGKIKKFINNKAQVNTLYPYHSRWSKGYVAVFKLPTSVSDSGKVKFIFTSSAGKSIFEF